MSWQSSGLISLNWTYNSIEGGMTRTTTASSSTSSLWYVDNTRTFSQNKNYQFLTRVEDFSRKSTFTHSKFLEIETPWGSSFSYFANLATFIIGTAADPRPFNNDEYDLVYFSSPSTETISTDMVEYRSTYNGFGNPASDSDGIPVIKEFKLVEFDWIVQGWSPFQLPTDSVNSRIAGWTYFESDDRFSFYPYTPPTNAAITLTQTRLPWGYLGSNNTLSLGYTYSNYIARYISYPVFNITFNAEFTISSTQSYFDVYLISDLTNSIRTNSQTLFNTQLSTGQFLGRIQGSDGDYTFYNLTGNQYILFNCSSVPNSGRIEISDFRIEGAYQENDNNTQFLFTESGSYSEPTELCLIGGSSDATYSVIVVNEDTLHNPATNSFFGPTGSPGFFSNLYGDVINLNQLNSKVGNGTFKAGIWENGVWNSGWRVDTNVYEFDDVEISLLMDTTNTRWRIQLTGPQTSTTNFGVGDKVSIGNIVGIDINENRKLMKNYFTVLSVNNTNIVVDFNNTFPLRRIEKDSENHKIKVTKNIWLNGGFLNGYFEGVWNSGLFKGFPYITEMYNTHWIDGRYDGGHFNGEYPEYTYVDTYYWGPTTPNTLGLTFGSTAHGFVVGDLVEIDKNDKSLNPQYDGFAKVIEVVDEYLIVVDKVFGASSTLEGGKIRRGTGTGVIQNFEFYDNNVATSTTEVTSNLKAVYNYNSWIDVKYLDESASNLGRNLIGYLNILGGEYVENNLYGYITRDVLSSISSFRNSHSLSKSIYSLGTKYKIYEDFLGDISEFNEPFGTSIQSGGLDNFINNGWTYSFTLDLFSPAVVDIDRLSNESLEIKITDNGTNIFKLNNINTEDIEKRRYSMIEFDLLSFESSSDEIITSPVSIPSIYLANTITTNDYNAFPVQEFVYHIRTENIKKYEYFYNRNSLNMLLVPSDGNMTASFDNIKFYELDMIPFFKYTTEEYVNKSIQVPYQGIAPFIDYSDNEFSFIDNIDIGLDSLNTEQSVNPPTSGGGVIGTPVDIFQDNKLL